MSITVEEKFTPSENVGRMKQSSTLMAMQAAQALRAQGVDVVDFGPGEPDFDTPENIKRAAAEAMRSGQTKYTATAGTKAFQNAVIDYYRRGFQADFTPSEVMATAGGKQAIFNAVVSLVNPGDEVLIVKPYWVTFPEIVTFARATPVYVETEDNDFVLTAEHIRNAITPRTKLVILNSPSNPSGRVIPSDEFERIIDLLNERGIYAISDECYLQFLYPPAEVYSVAKLPAERRKRVCIAGSFSKTYAMTGWRIGYALASPEWTKAMLMVQVHSTSNPNSIAQAAAIEAFNGPQDSVTAMLTEYGKRRDWLLGQLEDIPGFRCIVPEGAFYAFPNVRGCLGGSVRTSADFADLLLKEAHTVVTDGAGFGADGYIRMSYATSMERLEEGVRRIRAAASKLA
jgi:aspartate aminotransferase